MVHTYKHHRLRTKVPDDKAYLLKDSHRKLWTFLEDLSCPSTRNLAGTPSQLLPIAHIHETLIS